MGTLESVLSTVTFKLKNSHAHILAILLASFTS